MTTVEMKIVECDFYDHSHLSAIGDLLNAYIVDEMGGGIPLTDLQQLRVVNRLDNHPMALVLLAFSGSQPIGMLIGFENLSTFTAKPMINIHDLIVLPAFRRRGAGRMLMEKTIDLAHQRGCSRVTLEVRQDNVSAQSLYNGLGFQEANPPMLYWRKNL
jgi:ribosomal protein S18 acetylase RimI-like enzyme